MEEQNEIGYRFSDKGQVNFFAVQGMAKVKVGQALGQAQVKGDITAVAPPAPGQKLIAYGFADGKAQVVQPYFRSPIPTMCGSSSPACSPLRRRAGGGGPQGKALTLMVFEATKDKMATAAVTADGRGVMAVMSGEENFPPVTSSGAPRTTASRPCRVMWIRCC